MADNNKDLELRITRLEDAITKLAEARKTAEISEADMQTFMRVSEALNVDTCFCGPADCMACVRCIRCIRCIRCTRTLRCVRCINECTCGPCIAGGGFSGGFDDIGG